APTAAFATLALHDALPISRLVSPRHKSRLGMITSIVMVSGFGLGPLVGGLFGQWVPHPLITTYLPTLLLCGLALVIFLRLELPRSEEHTSELQSRENLVCR